MLWQNVRYLFRAFIFWIIWANLQSYTIVCWEILRLTRMAMTWYVWTEQTKQTCCVKSADLIRWSNLEQYTKQLRKPKQSNTLRLHLGSDVYYSLCNWILVGVGTTKLLCSTSVLVTLSTVINTLNWMANALTAFALDSDKMFLSAMTNFAELVFLVR